MGGGGTTDGRSLQCQSFVKAKGKVLYTFEGVFFDTERLQDCDLFVFRVFGFLAVSQ